MKKIYSLFAVIAMLTVALGFASCGNDDDNQQTKIFYKMGCSQFDNNGADLTTAAKEIKDMNSAFKKALGVDDTYFTMTGTSSDCDKDVAAKCKAAEATLSNYSFQCKFTFEVTNVNDNKVVYSFSR